jgi:uncharacterized protein (TIGR00661 family)
MANKVLFKVCSWGLGHATRSLPLIKQLLAENNEVIVASSGRSLELLKIEVGDRTECIEVPDMFTSFLRDCSWVFLIPKAPTELIRLWRNIYKENRAVEELRKKYNFDMIISDTCWGAYNDNVPSYLICHHLRPLWFWRTGFLQQMNEAMTWHASKNFTKVLIPDFEDDSLTGVLSHDFTYFQKHKVEYIGILSDSARLPVEQDIDYLVVISGAEPQRSAFVKQVLTQLVDFTGKTVVLLGEPEKVGDAFHINDHVEVLPFVPKPERDTLLNRARMVISRPGYTTIMDLIELGKKKVLFIPARNHTEQEYLADYHGKNNNVYSVSQRRLNLIEDIPKAEARVAFGNVRENANTKYTVNRVMDIVLNERRVA